MEKEDEEVLDWFERAIHDSLFSFENIFENLYM